MKHSCSVVKCEHTSVKYCKSCFNVYCEECNETWTTPCTLNHYWTSPYYPSFGQLTGSSTGLKITNSDKIEMRIHSCHDMS